MWDAIKYVTSAFTLLAFLVAAVVFLVRTWILRTRDLIKAADSPDRAKLVENALEYVRVDTSNLTREQKTDLAIRQIEARGRRYLIGAILIVILASILATTTVVAFLVSRHEQPKQPKTVTFRVLKEGQIVPTAFSAVCQDPSGGSYSISGANGEAQFTLPGDVHVLTSIIIELPCYEQLERGPVSVVEGRPIVINVRKVLTALKLSPLPPGSFPDPRVIIPDRDRPSIEALKQKDADPAQVVLTYENHTGKYLHLLLYSFDPARANSPWRVLPSDHCVDNQEFNGFTEATGWFAFIGRGEDGSVQYLGRINLYAKMRTRLVIKNERSNLTAVFQ